MTDEVLRLIRLGISDPGATTRRGVDNPGADPSDQVPENVRSWGARAVLDQLNAAGFAVVRRPPDAAPGAPVGWLVDVAEPLPAHDWRWVMAHGPDSDSTFGRQYTAEQVAASLVRQADDG